jgi:hypothetical protein
MVGEDDLALQRIDVDVMPFHSNLLFIIGLITSYKESGEFLEIQNNSQVF